MPKTGKSGGKKAVAKKTAVAKTGADREAEVKRILDKPTHHGTPTDMVVKVFELGTQQPGWKLDRKNMHATFTGPKGKGEVILTPGGYQTRITQKGQPPATRTFRNPTDAFNHARSASQR